MIVAKVRWDPPPVVRQGLAIQTASDQAMIDDVGFAA
jgi:hypothetical protein